jgi:hypothetical protein
MITDVQCYAVTCTPAFSRKTNPPPAPTFPHCAPSSMSGQTLRLTSLPTEILIKIVSSLLPDKFSIKIRACNGYQPTFKDTFINKPDILHLRDAHSLQITCQKMDGPVRQALSDMYELRKIPLQVSHINPWGGEADRPHLTLSAFSTQLPKLRALQVGIPLRFAPHVSTCSNYYDFSVKTLTINVSCADNAWSVDDVNIEELLPADVFDGRLLQLAAYEEAFVRIAVDHVGSTLMALSDPTHGYALLLKLQTDLEKKWETAPENLGKRGEWIMLPMSYDFGPIDYFG